MVVGASPVSSEKPDEPYPEHYYFEIGDLVLLNDGPDRGKIGIIVEKGKVWSNLLKRHYPEYDVRLDRRVLRCMSGFYMEKIA
jgi:hypothetical protein